ncbi:MAG: AsnC family transcriptional regulator [Proteobacteria bacterium]|nr:AsnC family transcriptional regulator [Pseudomonadota bacterium]
MDKLDARILNLIQSGFPLEKKPYRELARQTGIPEPDLVRRIKILKKKKIIRRLGGVLNSERLGYPGALVAARVPARGLERLARMVGNHPGVTHCYERKGRLNFWFTLQTKSRKDLAAVISKLEKESGIRFVCLPSRKRFKINFQIEF